MAINLNLSPTERAAYDALTREQKEMFEKYQSHHPGATIENWRQAIAKIREKEKRKRSYLSFPGVFSPDGVVISYSSSPNALAEINFGYSKFSF